MGPNLISIIDRIPDYTRSGLEKLHCSFNESQGDNQELLNNCRMFSTLFGEGSLMRVQYPKCAYGPYC